MSYTTHVLILQSNSLPTPPIWAFPSPNPKRTSNPHTRSHSPERRRITPLSIAKNIFRGAAGGFILCGPLVDLGVHDTPHCSSQRWNHSYNSPIRAEIFNSPDYGDDER